MKKILALAVCAQIIFAGNGITDENLNKTGLSTNFYLDCPETNAACNQNAPINEKPKKELTAVDILVAPFALIGFAGIIAGGTIGYIVNGVKNGVKDGVSAIGEAISNENNETDENISK